MMGRKRQAGFLLFGLATVLAWTSESTAQQRAPVGEVKVLRPSETPYQEARIVQNKRIPTRESRLSERRSRAEAGAQLRAERREQRLLRREQARVARAHVAETRPVAAQALSSEATASASVESPRPGAQARRADAATPVYRVFEGSPNPVTVEKAPKEKKSKKDKAKKEK